MHPRFSKDFVTVMIDQDRMTHGKEVASELRGGRRGGIPWMVILDGSGAEKITSDGPKGNCGCPAQPHEIDHFMAMLDTARVHMSDEDRHIIERELRAYGAKLTAPRGKTPGLATYSRAVSSVKYGQFSQAIGQLREAFVVGYPPEAILVDPKLRPLREDPDRRLELFDLAAKHVKTNHVQLVDRLEYGKRIRLRGTVVDMATGKPLGGALLRVFHTDATGEYRPGMDAGGGAGNPRLWGYLRTDAEGRFIVDSVMPERYTNSTVPRHVHYHVWAEGHPKLVSECFFDSDPNLTEAARKSAPSRNFPIVKLARDEERRLTGTLTVRVPAK